MRELHIYMHKALETKDLFLNIHFFETLEKMAHFEHWEV